ncbi:hypothetical protein HF500_11270 [Geobacillus subterraneus]|nr:hypothetical protein HF500_11270 [Geobacillus subterraneus]
MKTKEKGGGHSMKKAAGGLLAMALALGAGTVVLADTNGPLTFDQMLPHMKSMHPNLSEQQLQDMYNACHGGNGGKTGQPSQTMMNRF